MRLIFIALALIVAFFLFANWRTRQRPRQRSRAEVASEIEAFLNDGGKPYDWDDFLTFPIADPQLEQVRKRCDQIDWKSEAGKAELRVELEQLRREAS